jgi:hypothetical protein
MILTSIGIATANRFHDSRKWIAVIVGIIFVSFDCFEAKLPV